MKTLIFLSLFIGQLSLAQPRVDGGHSGKSRHIISSSDSTNLLKYQTPIKNQGHRDTSASFASVALVESMLKRYYGRDVNLSEQFVSWANVQKENGDPEDPVSILRTMDKLGVPSASVWPYSPIGFSDGTPPADALSASRVRVTNIMKIPATPETLVGFINSAIPVVVTVPLFSRAWSLDNPNSNNYRAGIVYLPQMNDTSAGLKQSVLLVGYDKNAKTYLFKNSWGTDEWSSTSNIPGYGTIPMDYVKKYGSAVTAQLKNL